MQKPFLCAALLSLCLLIIPATARSLFLGPEVLHSQDTANTPENVMTRNKGWMADPAVTANGVHGTEIDYAGLVVDLLNGNQDHAARLLVIQIFGGDIGWQGTRHDNGWIWDGTKPITQSMPFPEPATVLLLGFGMIGLAVISRRRIFR